MKSTQTTDLLNDGRDLRFFADAPARVLEVAGWLLDGHLKLSELVDRRLAKVSPAAMERQGDYEITSAIDSVVFDLNQLHGRVRYTETGAIELINPQSVARCVRLGKRQYLGQVDMPSIGSAA